MRLLNGEDAVVCYSNFLCSHATCCISACNLRVVGIVRPCSTSFVVRLSTSTISALTCRCIVTLVRNVSSLLSRVVIIFFQSVFILVEILKNVGQLADCAHRSINLLLQRDNHLVTFFSSWLLKCREIAIVLLLRQLVTSQINIVYRADDLTNLFAVSVFAVNLILEVLLQCIVLSLDTLDVTLKIGHDALLFIQLRSHVGQCSSFVLFDLLHTFIDCSFPIVELFVFVFQVDEASSKPLDTQIVILVNVFVVCNYLFEELSVLSQVLELTLSVVKFMFFLVDASSQTLNRYLMFLCRLVKLLETLIFLLALLLVLQNLLLI